MTWLAGFERREIGQPSGKPYDQVSNPKLCWHTWEGYSWSSAEAAFAPYPPHVAVNPKDGRRCQYVDLDRAAYALAGSDTEDSWVIQVEVAGYARETQDWPAGDLEWLGSEVLAPIAAAVPVPNVVTPYGFHGEGEGMILASPSSPIRYPNVGAWDGFAGHVGHQHAPAPDEHWDPGRLDVAAIIAAAGGGRPEPEPEPEDDDMGLTICRRESGDPQYVTDMVTFKTPIANPDAGDALVVCLKASGTKLFWSENWQRPTVVPDEVLDQLPTVDAR